MEKGTQGTRKRHFLNWVLTAVLIFAAMYLCAITGYRFVRNSNAAENPVESREPEINETIAPQEEDPLKLPEDLASASLPKEDVRVPSDPNDYLVISENGVVKLYNITESGDQIYSKDLDIAPDALLAEDKAQLEEGIILESEEELAALLEDYTS